MSFQDHPLPTRHFPDTGTAAMDFLLKNHPLAKDNQELQAQNRDLKAENQELANRLEKAFQENKTIRLRFESIRQERNSLFHLVENIVAAGCETEIQAADLQAFSDRTKDLINNWMKAFHPEVFGLEHGE